MDYEPSPIQFDSEAEARRWGFELYSCRYGNVYTVRQLVQLFRESFGYKDPAEKIWERGGRFFDAQRPGIDPVGLDSREDVVLMREDHLRRVRQMFLDLDVFIFTMGLTESWELNGDDTVFPSAPGAIAGTFDPVRYKWVNFSYESVYGDLVWFWDSLKSINPGARLLLTVSPVPMTATASRDHILVANGVSKSVLRAAAGAFADRHEDVGYFPSYEIITSAASRGIFFDPNMRTVNSFGIEVVMRNFFSGPLESEFGEVFDTPYGDDPDAVCDEQVLET
jgi:hypothetical protein